MTTDALLGIATCLAVAMVFLLVNIKAAESWLKLLTVIGLVGFLALAAYLTVTAVLP